MTQLFEKREIYAPFGLERLTKRVDQKKEAAKPYGMNPMQAAAAKEKKKAKKQKREKAKVKDRPEVSRVGKVQPYNNSDA